MSKVFKKCGLLMLAAILAVSVMACKKADKRAFNDISEVTIEKLTEISVVDNILKNQGGFITVTVFTNTGDALLEGAQGKNVYKLSGDVLEVNDIFSYTDGYTSNAYFSTKDTNYYVSYPEGNYVEKTDASFINDIRTTSILGYDSVQASVKNATEENGYYVITVDLGNGVSDVVTVDPTLGLITKVISQYSNYSGSGLMTCTTDITYDANVKMDYSSMEANGASVEETVATTAGDENCVSIATTDIYGNEVTDALIKDAKLVILNFWEPWCGPCVGEMPDLQKLYEAYKDQGLVILGVYSTFEQDAEALDIVKAKGITYPILRCSAELATLEQDYVPATYFLDCNGYVLTTEPFVGARDYSGWEKLIKEYLK